MNCITESEEAVLYKWLPDSPIVNYLLWMNRGKRFIQFFCLLFSGTRHFPLKECKKYMRLRSPGYTVASQSILKNYTCRMCTVSSWIPPGRGALGLWETGVAAFHQSYLFHLFSCGDVTVFGMSTQCQLCALTHPLPPRWEIINTHKSNAG